MTPLPQTGATAVTGPTGGVASTASPEIVVAGPGHGSAPSTSAIAGSTILAKALQEKELAPLLGSVWGESLVELAIGTPNITSRQVVIPNMILGVH